MVGEASDGYEAFALVGMVRASVVLMDINMRKMDGITAARLIRKQFPHVLVLGFSADANDQSVYAMRQAGAFEVLGKEDILKNLYATIRRGLGAMQVESQSTAQNSPTLFSCSFECSVDGGRRSVLSHRRKSKPYAMTSEALLT